MFSPDEQGSLTDPVCARPVDASTHHRHVYRGAAFCFCSARCCALFASDPTRYVVLVSAAVRSDGAPVRPRRSEQGEDWVAPEGLQLVDAGALPVGPMIDLTEPSARKATNPTLQLLTIPVWPVTVGESAQIQKPGTLPGELPGNRWRDLMAGLFPWREKRFAKRISRDLLHLYGVVSSSHPDLKGRDLYRKIIVMHNRTDADAAEILLDQAEESFAAWPTRRKLKFVDVVHFVAVSEFLASHGNSPWIYANMGQEVAYHIPDDL
jgi:YHS domain-containing protein